MGNFGIIFLCFFLFFFPDFLKGQQNYAVKTFTTDQGLPHNNVRGIAQDRNGFLWVATWDGLSRWDGYEFRNYYHNPNDSTTIIYFEADEVLVDYQNNVWTSNSFGVSKYNRASDNFRQYHFGIQTLIALDCEGKLWLSSETGIRRWNYQANRFELVPLQIDNDSKKGTNGRDAIRFDNENRLWFLESESDKNLFFRCDRLVNTGLNAKLIGTLDKQKYFPALNNYTWKFEILVSGHNSFWVNSNFGVFRFDHELKQFLPYSAFSAKKDLANINPETIVIAEEKYDFFKPIVRNNETQSKIRPIHVEALLKDNQNVLWQAFLGPGSSSTGLTRSISTPNSFKHYFFDQNPENGLNAIFPVLKDRFGSVWAGATNVNRTFKMDRDGLTSSLVPVDQRTWTVAGRPRVFLEDSLGIWMGYFNNLLLRYDFMSHQFSKEIFKETGLDDRSLPANFIHLRKEGDEIFVFGYSDIFKYNARIRKITSLKLFGRSGKYNIYSVLRDGKNGWWVGTAKSRLFYYDNQFNEIAHFDVGSTIFNVEDIVPGDNNDLWLALLGGGLAHFDKVTGKAIRIYTTADGLSNNTCYGMLKDKHGNLWVSTNHGISRFNPKTEQFRIYGPEDGLRIDEFNSDATFQAPDGEMFFGGMGGVVSFYPDSLAENTISEKALPLVIEDFIVSGKKRYFKKAIYECDTVTLNKGDDNFMANFACLDFRNAEKIKYRYKLDEEDKDFVQTDFRHRFLNYGNLLPGNYHLQIEASDADGDWASRRSLMIIIPAFYYQTVWFRVLWIVVGLLVVSLILFGYNRRIRLIAQKRQNELKLESLRGQMNPHFIFNSLNSINYFISQNDRLSANRYIADFSRLIRSILGNTTSDYIPLQNELHSLRDYLQLEHLRFSDKFDYEIDVDPDLDVEILQVSPGMVQPFVENAIWHGVRGLDGRKGFVNISIGKGTQPGTIQCIVEDDGIGRKLSEERKSTLPGKKSRGIAIILERQAIINNLRKSNLQIRIEDVFADREETGTKVTIDIPVC